MKIIIRDIKREDAEKLSFAFACQGWNKPISQFLTYYSEQKLGRRKVFVAELQGEVLGYVTLLPTALNGPYKNLNIPEICDFNVIKKYQNNGIGTSLMNAVESFVAQRNDNVCLAVGLHSGYGSAQRMYIKRGYVPDGSGLWYNGENLAEMASTCADDNLVLYLKKELKLVRNKL